MGPAKRKKLIQNFHTTLQQFMTGRGFKPCTRQDLLARLRIPEQHETIFHQALDKLVEDGIVIKKGRSYSLGEEEGEAEEIVKGTLRVHHRGFGFLQPDNPVDHPQDVFIPKHLTKQAVDGDRCEVVINTDSFSDKGPEGKVVAITERGRTHIAGTILRAPRDSDILAYVPLLGSSHQVIVAQPEDHELRVGDRVIMHVDEWGGQSSPTRCTMSHYIGHISDPSCDVRAGIEEFNIRSDFPRKAIEEAHAWGKIVKPSDMKHRLDLRDDVTLTIDPDTAKDFDDAITLTQDKTGHFHLSVHIADVTHYVRPGTALDLEAAQRCNSTYFPGRCVPMIPPDLSDNLCSLKPNVNRLAVSIMMELDKTGKLVDYKIQRTVIRSRKRFTYKEAKQVIDGKRKSQYKPTLDLMVTLCGLLKKQRHLRGSVEFALPEYAVMVNDEGAPTGVECIEYDITHQLVEEFMLKANELVATHLHRSGLDTAYRVHEQPAEENLKDFAGTVATFGFHLPEAPTPQDVQVLFNEMKGTTYYQYLAACYIRCMRLAAYSPHSLGHYGLSLEHYCHFTSPIRRYADVMVHRILLGYTLPYTELQQAAARCSEQERISARAESTVKLLKKLRLLKTQMDKDPQTQYKAVVTRVKPFGVFFELNEIMLEGFLHISELENDYYVYDDGQQALCGSDSGGRFTSGDKLLVGLSEINLITLETKWYLVDHAGRQGESSDSKRPWKKGSSSKPRKRESSSKPKQKRERKRRR